MSDDIKAFKTKDGKIVIHKAGCINIHSMDIARQIELKMKEPEMQTIPLRIDVLDRIGVLAEILNYIAKEKYSVKSLNTRFGKDGRVLITIDMEKTDAYEMDELIRQIKKTESVINAYVEER